MNAGKREPTYELASVLFMDIVNYSLRSIDDPMELMTALQRTVRETAKYKHASANQELISLPTVRTAFAGPLPIKI